MNTCGFSFDTTYTLLPENLFVKKTPDYAPHPAIICLNQSLSKELGLTFKHLSAHQQAQLFTGNTLPEGATPFAQAYAGHQFGHFTLLGDGRALILGEHLTPKNKRVDIQFKGSGRTPYSRSGDGKATLGPMLREYIISEAMYALGIPTTRALAVATTGESIKRETLLPGAVLTRVASSHIRVGTFEFAAHTLNTQTLQQLIAYTIKRHYPHLQTHAHQTLALIEAVVSKQIELIVDWMRVGFIHGVMNTDNMLLSGETIDYGPCAFMDAYHPGTVFSAIDQAGRYAYAHQPQMAQWNLARLLETLLPLLHDDMNKAKDIALEILHNFTETYQHKWLAMMRSKLGLVNSESGDEALISDLLDWMKKNGADYTNTFHDLSQKLQPEGKLYQQPAFIAWYTRWQNRLPSSSDSLCLRSRMNPVIIPRNHHVEQTIQAAYEGNFTPLQDFLAALQTPYCSSKRTKLYQSPPHPSERVYQTFCGT